MLRCQSYILEAKKKREKKKNNNKNPKKTTTTTKDFSGIERGAPDSMTNVLTITVQSSWISYFSTQPPWAFLLCPPKIYPSYAGGQRERPPIAVEVHYPRTTTSARLYFTCAL